MSGDSLKALVSVNQLTGLLRGVGTLVDGALVRGQRAATIALAINCSLLGVANLADVEPDPAVRNRITVENVEGDFTVNFDFSDIDDAE